MVVGWSAECRNVVVLDLLEGPGVAADVLRDTVECLPQFLCGLAPPDHEIARGQGGGHTLKNGLNREISARREAST